MMLIKINTLEQWLGEAIDDILHPLNIEDLWTEEELAAVGLVKPLPFVVPPGKRIAGSLSFVQGADGKIYENWGLEDFPSDVVTSQANPGSTPTRWLVRKSTIIRRLNDAGLLNTAFAALDQNPYAKARFWTPDWPSINSDDPEAIALLTAIGADVAVILAQEGS